MIAGYAGFAPDDGLFCLNFRSDRAREILAAIADPAFDGFARDLPRLTARLGMVSYSDAHDAWFETVFPKRDIRTRWARGWPNTGCASSAWPRPRNIRM